jgi:hypothetical protein
VRPMTIAIFAKYPMLQLACTSPRYLYGPDTEILIKFKKEIKDYIQLIRSTP